MRQITNTEDIIDSRDVIERIDELTQELTEIVQAIDHEDPITDEQMADLVAQRDDLLTELGALTALAEEASDYSEDWEYGATLIRDSYFEDYTKELADGIGAFDMKREDSWPLNCIDWYQAADELKQDYTSIMFGNVTYWVR